MPGGLVKLIDLRALRYLAASLMALLADWGCFLALLATGLPPAAASASGYTLGIAVHWLLSSRAVFEGTVAPRGPERMRQKTMFVASALIGLALTTMIVGASASAGLDPRAAKLAAVVVSFTATWLLREKVVFAARRAA